MAKKSSKAEIILNNFLDNMYMADREPEAWVEISIKEKNNKQQYLIKIRDYNSNFDEMMKSHYKSFSNFSDFFIMDKLNTFLYQAKSGGTYKSLDDFANQIKKIKLEKCNFSFRLYGLDIDSDEIFLGNYHLYKPVKLNELVLKNDNNLLNLYANKSSDQYDKENILHTCLLIKDLEFCEEDREFFIKSEVSRFLHFLYFFLGRKDKCKNIKPTFENINYKYFQHDDELRICGISSSKEESNYYGGDATLLKEAYENNCKKYFDLIRNHDTNLKKKLYNAIYWIGDSLADLSFSEGLLKVSIAAESLFTDSKENLGAVIAESVSFLVGKSVEERIEIFDNIKKCYDARSSLVHGDEISITYVKYYKLLGYLSESIRKIFELIDKKEDLSCEELKDYIKQTKFSC